MKGCVTDYAFETNRDGAQEPGRFNVARRGLPQLWLISEIPTLVRSHQNFPIAEIRYS